jgi:hypothetical protein
MSPEHPNALNSGLRVQIPDDQIALFRLFYWACKPESRFMNEKSSHEKGGDERRRDDVMHYCNETMANTWYGVVNSISLLNILQSFS